MNDNSYLFNFTGTWHVTHADGTTENIVLTHGDLVEDAKGSQGQFILSGPGPVPVLLGADWEPTTEELAAFEKALNEEPLRVIQLPEQGVSKTSPPFRSETSWAAHQIVKAACDSAMSADTADGWACAARDAAVVLHMVGTVLGPYHEGLASQCEALAYQCGRVVEHQPSGGVE